MVATTYNADGQILTLTAKNPVTGDQTTRYQYGTTADTSSVVRNDLRVAEFYPDAVDPADCVAYAYNRQSQPITKTDQNGTVHGYLFDLLGRPTSDIVTTLAAGVDDTVQRIDTAYEIRGMVNLVTSYEYPGGTGVVNQVLRTFNSFGQLQTEYQEHDGAVNTGTSLNVQYAYANGSANTVRPVSITYPNGRTISYMYNSGDDDALSRISYYSDSTATLVAYTYLGLGSIVQVSYPQPGVVYTLAGGSSPNPYLGLDGFGRVVGAEWLHGTTALVQIGYGYDLASNRTYRQDDVAEAAGAAFDESYGYDRMQRLVKLNRGTFSPSPSLSSSSSSSPSPSPSTGEGWGGGGVITGPTLQQGWHLDATGNWTNFSNVDQTNSANTLDQQRASNTANEITAINRTVGPQWATPAYDRNGNMTSIPEATSMANLANGTWDAWNRLVGYIDSSFNYHNSLYDGLNRRVTYAEADTPRDYYYSDSWQVLEERIPPNTGVPDRQFVWGLRYIDDCILRDRTTTGTLSERLFAMQDANWNVVAICNTSAAVLERYAYTAYGVVLFLNASFVPLSGNASAYAWESLYCGYRYQAATGLYLVRNRWLNSLLGFWLSRDRSSQQAADGGIGGPAWVLAVGENRAGPDPRFRRSVGRRTQREFGPASANGRNLWNGRSLALFANGWLGVSAVPFESPYGYANGNPAIATDPLGLDTYYVCGRKVQGNDTASLCARACGFMHVDIYSDDHGQIRVGFGGGVTQKGVTGKPADENCTELYRVNTETVVPYGPFPFINWLLFSKTVDKTVTWGVGAGTVCKNATDAEIVDCIRTKPVPKGAADEWHNCQTDCQEAADGCCLGGYQGTSVASGAIIAG